MQINAVIFDMDGVMFDTEAMARECLTKAGDVLGLENVREAHSRILGLNHENVVNKLCEYWDESVVKELLALTDEYIKKRKKEAPVPEKEYLHELLDYLVAQKYQIAVASSSKSEDILFNLRSSGIEDLFDAVIGSDKVCHSKPDPDIFLKTADYLRIPPDECLVIEDSINGLKAAMKGHFVSVFVPDLWIPGSKGEKKYIQYQCKNLKDVISFLEEQE